MISKLLELRSVEVEDATFPTDLVVAFGVTLVAVPVVTYLPRADPFRLIVALPVVFFLPGYGLVSALFPAEGDNRPWRYRLSGETSVGGVEAVERVALSFGLSVVTLPVVGLGLAVVPGGFERWTVALGVVIVVSLVVGGVRRAALPVDQQFTVSFSEAVDRVRRTLRRTSPGVAVVNVAAVVSLMLAAGVVLGAVVAPSPGATYTDVALLGATGDGATNATTGEAGNYRTRLAVGESTDLRLRVENHEREPVEYSVVVQLQRTVGGDIVRERRELTRVRERVPAGGTWTTNTSVLPTLSGDDLRLAYLVYRGTPPVNPTRENAYRSVYLRIAVG